MGGKGRGGGGEGRTVCACALNSRHSENSVLRTDNSVFKRHYRLLSGLSLGSLREREYNQYTSAEKRSHSMSSVFTTCLWNTGKSTLSRVFSPKPRVDDTRFHGRIRLLLHLIKSHEICRISTSFVLLHFAFILLL